MLFREPTDELEAEANVVGEAAFAESLDGVGRGVDAGVKGGEVDALEAGVEDREEVGGGADREVNQAEGDGLFPRDLPEPTVKFRRDFLAGEAVGGER